MTRCACQLIHEQHAGCIGAFTACDLQCRPIRLLSERQGSPVPTCWQKATSAAPRIPADDA